MFPGKLQMCVKYLLVTWETGLSSLKVEEEIMRYKISYVEHKCPIPGFPI